MMADFMIGKYQFEKWQGSEPSLPGEQIANFNKPGTNGNGQQQLGSWAEQFECIATAWIGGGQPYANYVKAKRLMRGLQDLRALDPQRVVFSNIDYRRLFGMVYHVDHVQEVSCQVNVLLVGKTVSYVGGVQLAVRFKLTPHLLT